MARPDLLVKVKELVTPALLALEDVSGTGVGTDALNVYLVQDSRAVRQRVQEIVASVAPDIPISFVVAGEFRAG